MTVPLIKKKVSKALEETGELVLVHSPEEIVWCNMEAAEFLGYENVDQLTGSSTEKIMEARNGEKGLVTFVKGDGTTISCLISHHIMEDEDSDVTLSIIQPINSDKLKHKLEKLLYDMKHEVNTPLSVIKGYTELLQEKDLDPETREFIEIMMRNIERLEKATKKVLDKIEKD